MDSFKQILEKQLQRSHGAAELTRVRMMRRVPAGSLDLKPHPPRGVCPGVSQHRHECTPTWLGDVKTAPQSSSTHRNSVFIAFIISSERPTNSGRRGGNKRETGEVPAGSRAQKPVGPPSVGSQGRRGRGQRLGDGVFVLMYIFVVKYPEHKYFPFSPLLRVSSAALSSPTLLCNHNHHPTPNVHLPRLKLCTPKTPNPCSPGNHHPTHSFHESDYSRCLMQMDFYYICPFVSEISLGMMISGPSVL